MKFRPCIDIHNGSVKQIVGGSLKDEGDSAQENFVSVQDASFFSKLYREYGLCGGHIILLNPVSSSYYEETKRQALSALSAYPGGLQVGGGITPENAVEFLEAGASHVIVTSYVFRDGMPLLRASSLSSVKALAVMAMIGMEARSGFSNWRIHFVASYPSITGICTSISTT